MKILIGAYACEPGQGSEPAVGWHWAHEAVKAGHEVCVITRSNNREAIEGALEPGTGPHPKFEYVDLPAPFLWAKARGGHLGLLGYYYLWQVALYFKARRAHRRERFDLTHHVTFVNDTMPSGLALLPLPFIWGPVGGSTHRLPREVDLDLPPYARRHELIRRALQFLLKRVDPFVWLTRRRATLILVFTRDALRGLPADARRRARAVVHIGVTEDQPPPRTVKRSEGSALQVLTGGRLVHWKGLDLLIEGFAKYVGEQGDQGARLLVTGSGSYQGYLEDLARREGVADQVSFLGHLPRREDVFELMEACNLYALPTFRDGPPVALLEAMASGVPVLCLDRGATAELVPEGAGFKLRVTGREQIVDQIADACEWVSANPERADEIGATARRLALETHHWDRIREEIAEAYREAARRAGLPFDSIRS